MCKHGQPLDLYFKHEQNIKSELTKKPIKVKSTSFMEIIRFVYNHQNHFADKLLKY